MTLDDVLRRYGAIVEEALKGLFPRVVDEDYLRWLTDIKESVFDMEALDKALLTPAWDLLERGGKRWRPIMMLLTYEALGGDPHEIAHLTIIPELIHNGTLAVDDVEDDSYYRRGKPCIHRIYGQDVAINMGNTLYYLPLVVALKRSNISDDKKLGIYKIYTEEMLNLSLGQAMDIAWHRSLTDNVSERHYMLMCSLKTGSLARMAVRIACIVAGAPKDVEDRIAEFASAVAVAFQMQDDVLNVVGEEGKYGKEIGGDIREGKRTLIVIHALTTLPEEDAKRLKSILMSKPSDKLLISEAIELFNKAGSIEYTKQRSRELVSTAWREVSEVFRDSEAKESLHALVDFLINREF